MITLAQVETLEGCSRLLIQKLASMKTALGELKEKSDSMYTPSMIRKAAADVDRQELLVIACADELNDELTKLLKPRSVEPEVMPAETVEAIVRVRIADRERAAAKS